MYDSRLSESENEAIWQADNRMRIEHSMMEFFQPDDYRIVMDVMMRRYREYYQHELEPRHFFDATFDPLSNMVGLTVEQFKSLCMTLCHTLPMRPEHCVSTTYDGTYRG